MIFIEQKEENFFPRKKLPRTKLRFQRDWHDLAKKQRQNTCFASALTFPESAEPVLTLTSCFGPVNNWTVPPAWGPGKGAELQPLGELGREPLLLIKLSSWGRQTFFSPRRSDAHWPFFHRYPHVGHTMGSSLQQQLSVLRTASVPWELSEVDTQHSKAGLRKDTWSTGRAVLFL